MASFIGRNNTKFNINNFLTLNVRNYSTGTPSPIVPGKIYANADVDKLQILQENKGKTGIYRWVHKESGKTYVGSSVNLSRRMRDYFNIIYLESEIKRTKSIIYKSLLKSGYSSFSLEILEYCEPSEVILREQYYLDLLKPEYNILKTAGSTLGYKHSEESMLWEHLDRLNSSPEQREHLNGLNYNAEEQAKRLAALKISNLSQKNLEHLKRLHEKRSVPIQVLDRETGISTTYVSMSEAARALGLTAGAIRIAFKRKGESTILIKDKRYQLTKLSDQ